MQHGCRVSRCRESQQARRKEGGVRAPEKKPVKARKKANKKAIQRIFSQIPYFLRKCFSGRKRTCPLGYLLVRWAEYLSVGASNFSVGLPFCCLFFVQESSKKSPAFFRRPRRSYYSQLRVIRKQENQPTPLFLSRIPVLVRITVQEGPLFLTIKLPILTPQFLNVSASFHPQLAVS